MITVRINRVRDTAVLPKKGTPGSAGLDLYADLAEEQTILPGQTLLVPTGWAFEIPAGYAGFVFARSGLASREGLAPANKVGVVDSDYRGEVLVPLHNHSGQPRTVSAHERIAQMIVLETPAVQLEESMQMTETARDRRGFGSTGKE